MAEKFVYFMAGLTKVYPPQKEVLKDIYLSFYYGAKIGIIVRQRLREKHAHEDNGGIDKEYRGEAWVESGRTVGYLSQEPRLDENLTVAGNVELAVASTRKLLHDFDEISNKFSETDVGPGMEKLLERQARLQDKIDMENAWNLTARLR